MRRLWLICFVLILAGCTSAQITLTPTLQGPVVPTRNIQPTQLTQVSLLPSPTLQLAAEITEPATDTDTPTGIPSATLADTATLPPTTLANSATTPPTATLADTPTGIPSATATLADTATGIPSATATHTATNTAILTATATATTSPSLTNTATLTETPTVLPSPTSAPSSTPAPTEPPTETPSPSPAVTETLAPNITPTEPILFRNATSFDPVIIQGAISLDTPISGTIDDQHPAQLYAFDATANETIDVTMTAQSRGNLDAFLLLLDPKGREIVRNDNIDNDHIDAAIRDVSLPESGQYIIVATRYGQEFGSTSGDFDLTVSDTHDGETSLGDSTQAMAYDTLVNGTLDDSTTQQDYSFRATAGDVISIAMNQVSNNLDPILALTNNLGTTIAWNDDNQQTGTLDAAIQNFIIPRSGYYTIVATHYLGGSGNSGDYRMKLARTGQNDARRYAITDMINSTTMDELGTLYAEFTAGDTIGDNNVEHSLQTLLTFRLPPDDNRVVQSATLALQPCRESGGGFSTLGDLTIYRDNYGKLNSGRNLTHPLPGARVLSVQSDCSPLDLTALVQEAYASGVREIRLRLVFRSRTDNGVEDAVYFTPSLLIDYGQQ
ncbi:MAG TPA: hypothetical protein VHD90_03360 [Phototrophicaceae bacterium]|nr:hypothetical protein [Phototrophicaceae bacterium]